MSLSAFIPPGRDYTKKNPHPLTALFDEALVHGEDDVGDVGLRLLELLPIVPPEYQDGVAIALYQPGNKRILVVRRKGSFLTNLVQAAVAVRRHPRFPQFKIGDGARIQVDFLSSFNGLLRFQDLTSGTLDHHRFEFGVDGFHIKSAASSPYFLPGDSYVRSIYELGQLGAYLERVVTGENVEDCLMERFQSTSVVSYGDQWIRLFRGHPVMASVAVADVELACDRAIDHIVAYVRKDGRFLYYYDAAGDTEVDHAHPNRDPERNPYYNELRHCGGIVCLLMAHERNPDPALRPIIERAFDYVLAQSRTYTTTEGRIARHIYFNRKSKLGGSGLALYAMSYYQKVFGDARYSAFGAEFAEHLLACITGSGEFIYYTIYLDKEITEAENPDYFSFYYPGEALIGLACYFKWVAGPGQMSDATVAKIRSALHYLLVERPVIHAAQYKNLPSDAWLMAAILALHDFPAFRDPIYTRFVFDDADRMASLMYQEGNALYPDYVGAFYYSYGDLPYPDGARCEGFVAALELAMKVGDDDRARHYASALVRATFATLLLANTPESLYFARNPVKALGGVRFKLTRQWFRIDTIQHVVCFYLRFLRLYKQLMNKGVQLDVRFAENLGNAKKLRRLS
jgi:hypothetical protein